MCATYNPQSPKREGARVVFFPLLSLSLSLPIFGHPLVHVIWPSSTARLGLLLLVSSLVLGGCGLC